MSKTNNMAEEEGFEPSERCSRSTVFKTAAFNHSATPPKGETAPVGAVNTLAESQGFEPWRRFRRLHDFQSCSFGHSDNSPYKVHWSV